jgi:hypothetical protein
MQKRTASIILFFIFIFSCEAILRFPTHNVASYSLNKRGSETVLAAVLPGSPLVTGTLAQGLSNGISLYSNILLARLPMFLSYGILLFL